MNPRTQDCLGHYLYGAGYFAREDNTLGIVTGHGTSQPHFCLTCPKRALCEDEHEKRVRRLRGQEAERFDRMMAKARQKGIAPTLAAVWMGKNGLDPFMDTAIDNFKRGHADRGKIDGPLVK